MPFDPVVLIPPLLCDARVFWDQIGVLSVQHPVMCVPVHGFETVGEMAQQVLDHAPERFAVAGAGMGGMVALEVIHRAPERVSRIALINTVAQADTPATASARETQIIAAKSGRFQDVIAHEMDEMRLHAEADRAHLGPLLQTMAEAVGPEPYIAAIRAMQKRKDQQAVLRKIRQPALVVCGDSDPQTVVRRQEFIAEMIPYATLKVVEQAGFLPSLEKPEVVSAILQEWARQPLVLR